MRSILVLILILTSAATVSAQRGVPGGVVTIPPGEDAVPIRPIVDAPLMPSPMPNPMGGGSIVDSRGNALSVQTSVTRNSSAAITINTKVIATPLPTSNTSPPAANATTYSNTMIGGLTVGSQGVYAVATSVSGTQASHKLVALVVGTNGFVPATLPSMTGSLNGSTFISVARGSTEDTIYITETTVTRSSDSPSPDAITVTRTLRFVTFNGSTFSSPSPTVTLP